MTTNRISALLSRLCTPIGQALAIALLALAAGGAQATGTRGTQVDNFCAAKAPARARPSRAGPTALPAIPAPTVTPPASATTQET